MLKELRETFDKVKMKHFMQPYYKRNGKTIAVIFDGDSRYVGISECGKKDQFSRAKGRLIALNRALYAAKNKTNNGSHFTFDVNNIPQNIIDNVPQHLYTSNN